MRHSYAPHNRYLLLSSSIQIDMNSSAHMLLPGHSAGKKSKESKKQRNAEKRLIRAHEENVFCRFAGFLLAALFSPDTFLFS